ncbi:MAG: 2-C-methyl-D-erythritol 2,4-cyclodiphosphate synthase [Clostridia bacterium]|nr:2-C-methyl-D-erythritol 2,4-cyclodiphosphate synthase [Clostridia bacterium]
MRIGIGCDTHRLTEGRKLILGGIEIEHDKGLLGHSDADALIHAVIDALLGAAGLGDIGTLFPDTDMKYKDISSLVLLEEAGKRIKEKGFEIVNIDTIIIAQKPKMAPYKALMAQRMAETLKIDPSQINVKAKTNEKMGFTGREEGIETRAVALLN